MPSYSISHYPSPPGSHHNNHNVRKEIRKKDSHMPIHIHNHPRLRRKFPHPISNPLTVLLLSPTLTHLSPFPTISFPPRRTISNTKPYSPSNPPPLPQSQNLRNRQCLI